EPIAARRTALAAELPGVVVQDALVGAADGAVIAVKPGDVPAAAETIGAAGIRRVLSIAAGVKTAAIEDALGVDAAVVRAMPNTPALVRAGAAAIAPGRHAGDAELDWAASILGAVGTVVRVPEAALDAVTGLSGSGPAYVFLLAEALIDAGVYVGLARDVSVALTTQLLVGAAALLVQSGETPEMLRARVTSPGGTTAAGLRALETAGMRAAVLEAVLAATERSRELGGA
ncbi:MAG TPA: pyrroline-5-carboxylate reductase, partial [Acidimicrobiales bacterium]|nr:pyrroline-5-carboxylate reductase [Acidimicrobiales bacterium]